MDGRMDRWIEEKKGEKKEGREEGRTADWYVNQWIGKWDNTMMIFCSKIFSCNFSWIYKWRKRKLRKCLASEKNASYKMDQFIEYLFKRNNVKNTVLDSIYWRSFVKKNVEISIPNVRSKCELFEGRIHNFFILIPVPGIVTSTWVQFCSVQSLSRVRRARVNICWTIWKKVFLTRRPNEMGIYAKWNITCLVVFV